jgi:hypothetical protein
MLFVLVCSLTWHTFFPMVLSPVVQDLRVTQPGTRGAVLWFLFIHKIKHLYSYFTKGRAETSVACKQHVLLSGKKENKILRIPTFIIFFKDCDFQNISFDFCFPPIKRSWYFLQYFHMDIWLCSEFGK